VKYIIIIIDFICDNTFSLWQVNILLTVVFLEAALNKTPEKETAERDRRVKTSKTNGSQYNYKE
jgi:hypothetical protein